VKKPPVAIGKAKPKLKINQLVEKQVQPPTQVHRRLWMAAKVIGGFVVTLTGLLGTVYGVVGPPWPTEPVFLRGPPSFGSPLNIPFSVTNKSGFVGIRNLKLECMAHWIKLSNGGSLKDTMLAAPTVSVLEPLQSRPYFCPFHVLVDVGDAKLSEASITVIGEYDSPWPWQSGKKLTSHQYWLNTKTIPPQWMSGPPL